MRIGETRLSSSYATNINLPEYLFIHNASDTRSGGTGLYISNKPTYIPQDDLSSFIFSSGPLESTCEIKHKNKKNILVYKHPSMDIDIFNENFISPFLSKISRENKLLVIMGDFNINLLHCDESPPIANFLDIFGSYHMLPRNISYY